MVLLSGDVCPNPGWSYANLNRPGLKIGHLNICSLPKHMDELKILLYDNPFHIMCLNETWLNSSWTDSELQTEGYNLIRNYRPDSQCGGGTAIYFSTELTGRHRPDLSTSEPEAVRLELRSPNNSRTLICSIYRPPNNDLEVFKTNIEGVLDKISTERANIILAGDLNEDMKGKRLTTQAKGLNQLFNIYQLKQLIKEPTRKTEHTSSLIDLVYTSEVEKIVASGVLNCAISAHSLVYLVRRSKKPRTGCKFIRYRCYKNYTPEKFCTDLLSASWDSIDTSLTVDGAWKSFNKTLTSIMDQHAPFALSNYYMSHLIILHVLTLDQCNLCIVIIISVCKLFYTESHSNQPTCS